MADIFTKSDASQLLRKKHVLLLGDSNMRTLYKDLVYLLVKNDMTPSSLFRNNKGNARWASFMGDKVLALPARETAGRSYKEIRELKMGDISLRYSFITRVYGCAAQQELRDLESGRLPLPDIVIVNSCIWDLTRWGAKKEDVYKEQLIQLFARLRALLPEETLVIWTSTLPVASERVKGGVLIQQLDFIKHSMRFMILEANQFTHQLCVAFDIDYLDLHYHMRFQLHRRTTDGLHWETHAVRHMTLLILTHIALALKLPLPNRIDSKYLSAAKNKTKESAKETVMDINLDQEIINLIREEYEKAVNRSGNSGIRKKCQIKRRVWEVTVDEKNTKQSFQQESDSSDSSKKPKSSSMISNGNDQKATGVSLTKATSISRCSSAFDTTGSMPLKVCTAGMRSSFRSVRHVSVKERLQLPNNRISNMCSNGSVQNTASTSLTKAKSCSSLENKQFHKPSTKGISGVSSASGTACIMPKKACNQGMHSSENIRHVSVKERLQPANSRVSNIFDTADYQKTTDVYMCKDKSTSSLDIHPFYEPNTQTISSCSSASGTTIHMPKKESKRRWLRGKHNSPKNARSTSVKKRLQPANSNLCENRQTCWIPQSNNCISSSGNPYLSNGSSSNGNNFSFGHYLPPAHCSSVYDPGSLQNMYNFKYNFLSQNLNWF